MAIMSARTDGLGFDSEILSDCGALWPAVRALLDAGIEPAAMRDCTRGGLATVLAEWAQASRCDLVIEEAAIPVAEPVRAACEILGLDPLYVACEGRFVASVPESQAARAVEVLRALPDHPSAAVIGSVRSAPGAAGMALALQPYGSDRILDMLAGEALPRIC
jgi:hydrogenase expression/formation protein HypE